MQRETVVDLSVANPSSMMKGIDRSLSSYDYERFCFTKVYGKRKVFELPMYDDSMVDLSKLYIKVKFTGQLSEDVNTLTMGWELLEYINLNYGGVDVPLFECDWELFPMMLELYCKLNGGKCDVVVHNKEVEMLLCLPIKITGYLPMNLPIKLNVKFREFPDLKMDLGSIEITARRLVMTQTAIEMYYTKQTRESERRDGTTASEAGQEIPNDRIQDVVKTSLSNYKLVSHKNMAQHLDCCNQDFMMVGIFSKNDMSQTVNRNKLRFSKFELHTGVGPFRLNNLLLNYDNFSKAFSKDVLPISYDSWKYGMNWFTVIFNPNFDLNDVTIDKSGKAVVLQYTLEGSVIDNEESLDDYEMLVYSSQTNRMKITDYRNVSCYI